MARGLRSLYRVVREVLSNTTNVYPLLEYEEWIPETIRALYFVHASNDSKTMDNTYAFTDGRLVHTRRYGDGNVVTTFYRVRNATWLVYMVVTRYEWDGKSAVELRIAVHGSKKVYNRVRRFLRRLGFIA